METVCRLQSPTQEQRLAALYNAACVHASFGDVELAQIPLKDGEAGLPAVHAACWLVTTYSCRAAIYGGLDLAAALEQQDERYVKLRASAQVGVPLSASLSWPAVSHVGHLCWLAHDSSCSFVCRS
jgi:hypothetical protein